MAFVAFGFLGFRGFCGFCSTFDNSNILFFILFFLSFSLAAVLLSLFSFAFLFAVQRRNQTRKEGRKQASKQARAAHLWIWCAAGGALRPPQPPHATKSALHLRHPRLPRNQYFKVNSPVQKLSNQANTPPVLGLFLFAVSLLTAPNCCDR